MYLLNRTDITKVSHDTFDCYSVKFDDSGFNLKKLTELLSYCNPDLNNKIVFPHKINYMMYKTDVPLHYPLSTLLLVSLSQDNWERDIDSKIVNYIRSILTMYDPTNLVPIYELIRNDDELKGIDNEIMLDSYLEKKYKDIAIFREVFKHLEFTQLFSQEIGDFRIFINSFKNMKLIKSNLMIQYFNYNIADKNAETIKLLQLTPNIRK